MNMSTVISIQGEATVNRVENDDSGRNRIRIIFGDVTLFVGRDDALELAGAIRQAATQEL